MTARGSSLRDQKNSGPNDTNCGTFLQLIIIIKYQTCVILQLVPGGGGTISSVLGKLPLSRTW